MVLLFTYLFLQFRLEMQRMQSEDPRVWDPVITEFEQEDKASPPPLGAVLFVGSSTIRLWDTLTEDMKPLVAFGRGFGGAKIIDISYYVNRIVTPYQPKAVVVYIGGNDFSEIFDNQTKTLTQTKPLYLQLIDRLKEAAPNAPIFFVALKPTTTNWHQKSLINSVNQFLKSRAELDERLFFIDANQGLYNAQGLPNADFLWIDGVHINSDGYKVWGAEIKRVLLEVL